MTTDPQRAALGGRLARHGASRTAMVIAFLWGFAEATVFFIVPDVYLGFIALFQWRRGLLAVLATVLGAMAGGALMYGLAAANPRALDELLLHIPLVKPEMLSAVSERLQVEGLLALVSGPLLGIPYKIYAVQAGQQQLPLLPFLLMTIPARLERILPAALAGAGAGIVFRKFIRQHAGLVTGAYVLLWLGIYAVYAVVVR